MSPSLAQTSASYYAPASIFLVMGSPMEPWELRKKHSLPPLADKATKNPVAAALNEAFHGGEHRISLWPAAQTLGKLRLV